MQMAVFLALLPVYDHGEIFYSQTILHLEHTSSLWPKIEALPSCEANKKIYSYLGVREDIDSIKQTATESDGFGLPLRLVTVKSMLTLQYAEEVMLYRENIAAFSYLREIHAGTYIALYWYG